MGTNRPMFTPLAIALSIATGLVIIALTTTFSACDMFPVSCTEPPDTHRGLGLSECSSDSESSDCCTYSDSDSDCTYTLCHLGCNEGYDEITRSWSCYANGALPDTGNWASAMSGGPYRGTHRASDQVEGFSGDAWRNELLGARAPVSAP